MKKSCLFFLLMFNISISLCQIGLPIGSRAKDFSQFNTQGVLIKFSEYKGKYVLLEFWASWCGPCRKENPNLIKVYDTYHPKGLEILSVSLDKDKEAWLKAIQEDKLSKWKHVSDLKFWDNKVAKLYNVEMLPCNMLINPKGKVIARNLKKERIWKQMKLIFK